MTTNAVSKIDSNIQTIIIETLFGSYADTAAQARAEYIYSSYGEILMKSGDLADKNNITYSTRYQEANTGLVSYAYRHYSPRLKKWLSKDPIAESGGINLYQMVGNQPVGYWDMLGLAISFSFKNKTPPECKCELQINVVGTVEVMYQNGRFGYVDYYIDQISNILTSKWSGTIGDMKYHTTVKLYKKGDSMAGDNPYEIKLFPDMDKPLDNGEEIIGDAPKGTVGNPGNYMRIFRKGFNGVKINPQTLSHEFGHSLGLDHTDEKNNLMNPYSDDKSVNINEDQIRQIIKNSGNKCK